MNQYRLRISRATRCFSSSDMPTKIVVVVALLTLASFAHGATKCRSGNKILYLTDVCPAGYTDITSTGGTGVSTIGKSANVQRQEQEFLASKTADERANRAQLAQEQQQLVTAENNQRTQCNAIDAEIRANEIAMRQINAWQMMDQLKRNHQLLRDQQFQIGCHR
ncbi:hypothetical protein [Cupriavidus sp. CuC1]|uniref:hypothetical protein n=1 Tax=Cupriavidus sp. CuC1 TaxID=3373131 RepID=UPI0037CD0C19